MTNAVDGAERMRQADKVIEAVTAKLQANRRILESCQHGIVKWRFDARGRLEVELQPTL